MIRLRSMLRGVVSGALVGGPVAYLYGVVGFALGWYGPAIIWFQATATIILGVVSGVLAGGTIGLLQVGSRKGAASVGLGYAVPYFLLTMGWSLLGAAGVRDWKRELIVNLGCVLLFVPLAVLSREVLEWWLRVEPLPLPEPVKTSLHRSGDEPRRYRI